MILTLGSGREVEVAKVSGEEDDIQIDQAFYTDTQDEVTDEDLEEIYTMYPEMLFEKWYEREIAAAEAAVDAAKDNGTY